MKGAKCRCGFASSAVRTRCPRCHKIMRKAEWPNRGKVLSFTTLSVVPNGFDMPMNLVMVAVEKGPKITGWSKAQLGVGDEVEISEHDGQYLFSPAVRSRQNLRT